MKILAGIHRPDSGEIRIDGAPVVDARSGAMPRRLGIGVIHQELEIIDTLDVAGNVFLGREPRAAAPCACSIAGGWTPTTERQLARIGVGVRAAHAAAASCPRHSSSSSPSRAPCR